MPSARLAVDIGGTFTDLALEHDGKRTTIKVLTTSTAPEQGVLAGVRSILQSSGVAASDIGIVIHGTTLATNAVIERKGARTALITTQGFRDVIAMGNESRYDQYDLNIVLPEPLVPRYLRLPIPERLDNEGNILLPLDSAARASGDTSPATRRRRKHRRRFPPRLRQPGARAPCPRHPGRSTAGHPDIAFQRSVARDARVGTLLHHRRQRLRAAADGALSARSCRRPARPSGIRHRCS